METILIIIVIAMVIVIFVIHNIHKKSPVDKKVYHYAATISGGVKNGAFGKIYQEVWIQKKRILLEGYLNERYSIIQTNRKNNPTEYVCKDSRHTTYLLLFDTNRQTGILINEHQAGILFSHDEPVEPVLY